MKLNRDDYGRMAAAITDDCGYVEFEKEGNQITFGYDVDVQGYEEDDYYDGTGMFVVTNVFLKIKNVEAFDVEGNRIDVELDENLLQELVEYNRTRW